MAFALALLMFSGCSMFISTPRVAHIQIHGMDSRIDDYAVVLDPQCKETTFDIRISDRYAINLDFEWLFNATTGIESINPDGRTDMDWSGTPWMMCTYRF